jgi:hypothetical protein
LEGIRYPTKPPIPPATTHNNMNFHRFLKKSQNIKITIEINAMNIATTNAYRVVSIIWCLTA